MEWLSKRFELSRGGEAHNIRTMEGLRGLAIFLVFWVHYITLVTPWIAGRPTLLSLGQIAHGMGNIGVDLFFVLSGYLIYGSLIARRQNFWRYMARRIQRIYPTFLVVFVIYLWLSLVWPSQSKLPHGFVSGFVYLIQNFLLLPGICSIQPMITVAWSLSYEVFFYLTIPMVIAVLDLRQHSSQWRIALFSMVAIVGLLASAALGGPVRMLMFLSGVLLYEVVQFRKNMTVSSTGGMVALVLGLCFTIVSVPGNVGGAQLTAVLFVTFFLLCLACFTDGSNRLPRLLCWTPLRWLGNMSYSYYLLHGLALKAAFAVMGVLVPATGQEALLAWTMLPVMFAWTLIASALLFVFVERPFSLMPKTSGRVLQTNAI